MINKKIQESIEIIKRSEKIALKYNDFGFHVAFSGGKDSQVIYELCKMAGVTHKPFFYKTSIDPPELLKFIKENYPEVDRIKPEMTMFQLIIKKGFLPTRTIRFCCDVLKERKGLNSVVITGIRKQESNRRKNRNDFEFSCKNGKDKILCNPILNWTTKEVFKFLSERNIEVCSLYNHFKRIGCVGCPMNPKDQRAEFKRYPNVKKAYINTVGKLMQIGKFENFDSAEDVIDWWISGTSLKNYMNNKKQLQLFDA